MPTLRPGRERRLSASRSASGRHGTADRIRRPAAQAPGGYPTLREHLTSRRDFLTWAGTSVAVAASMTACISGEDGGTPYYLEGRLPETGVLAIELSGGGVLSGHVDLVCTTYASEYLHTWPLTEATRLTIGQYSYAELRGLFVTGGAERHRALEEEMEDAYAAASGDEARFTVALTLVALTV